MSLAPLRWPRLVPDGEALVLDAAEADMASVWVHALWLEGLVQASTVSRAVVSRGGEPHAGVEAITARLRARSCGDCRGTAPHAGGRWRGRARTCPAASGTGVGQVDISLSGLGRFCCFFSYFVKTVVFVFVLSLSLSRMAPESQRS